MEPIVIIRSVRDELLQMTDWTQLPDVTRRAVKNPHLATEWALYREALRNITDPEPQTLDVEWPKAPDPKYDEYREGFLQRWNPSHRWRSNF
jgi:hypothetical protein